MFTVVGLSRMQQIIFLNSFIIFLFIISIIIKTTNTCLLWEPKWIYASIIFIFEFLYIKNQKLNDSKELI